LTELIEYSSLIIDLQTYKTAYLMPLWHFGMSSHNSPKPS